MEHQVLLDHELLAAGLAPVLLDAGVGHEVTLELLSRTEGLCVQKQTLISGGL